LNKIILFKFSRLIARWLKTPVKLGAWSHLRISVNKSIAEDFFHPLGKPCRAAVFGLGGVATRAPVGLPNQPRAEPRRLWLCTVSTNIFTFSGGVNWEMPWPRLNTWPPDLRLSAASLP